METSDLLHFFLPEVILTYFDINTASEQSSKPVTFLKDKPLTSEELSNRRLHSKGFYPAVELQNYPVRRKARYYQVKLRRCIHMDTAEPYTRDWNLVAK